jgi:GTP-binding protein
VTAKVIPPGRVRAVGAEFLLSAMKPAQYPKAAAPEVCFLGRSNVGKSSLLNHLVGQHGLARVSKTPGCTRAVNFFQLRLQAGLQKREVRLVDLPGYGFAKMSHEEQRQVSGLLLDYLEAPRPLAGSCLLLDVRREASAQDVAAAQGLSQRGPVLLVVTKVDKLALGRRKPRAAALARTVGLTGSDVVMVTVREEAGRDRLLDLMWTLTAVAPVLPPKGGA